MRKTILPSNLAGAILILSPVVLTSCEAVSGLFRSPNYQQAPIYERHQAQIRSPGSETAASRAARGSASSAETSTVYKGVSKSKGTSVPLAPPLVKSSAPSNSRSGTSSSYTSSSSKATSSSPSTSSSSAVTVPAAPTATPTMTVPTVQ